MERYGTFINVDGDNLKALKTAPANYEASVVKMLKRISSLKVGFHLLSAIKRTGKQVLIRPGETNMATHRNPIVMWKQPYIVNRICELGTWECPEEMLEHVTTMPHRFGDVFIFFRPDHPVKPFLPRALLRGLPEELVEKVLPYREDPRTRAEDVLVHELFHALRMLAVRDWQNLTHQRLPGGFVFVEELYAILVENMYRSEQGRDHELRGSWSRDFERLDSNDLKIRLDYGFYLTRLEAQMPELTSQLRALPTKFNPFRIRI